MKLLVAGCNGQLGSDMMRIGKSEGHQVIGVDYPEFDITKEVSCFDLFRDSPVDIVINCTAYTAVDACEENQDTAFDVNAQGPENLALAARKSGTPVVHISTDYVFNGRSDRPYIETDKPDPQTVYGESKLEGEVRVRAALEQHYIFRIAWLYGTHGSNFVKTIRTVARAKEMSNESLKVVNDQYGTPTYTVDVCRQILRVVGSGRYGLYHCTSEGACTWYDFTLEILRAASIGTQVEPCTTAEFVRPAKRPAYSVLENHNLKKAGLNCMPNWLHGFKSFLLEEESTQQ